MLRYAIKGLCLRVSEPNTKKWVFSVVFFLTLSPNVTSVDIFGLKQHFIAVTHKKTIPKKQDLQFVFYKAKGWYWKPGGPVSL